MAEVKDTADLDSLLSLLDWSDDIPHRKGLYTDEDENRKDTCEGEEEEEEGRGWADMNNAEGDIDTQRHPTSSDDASEEESSVDHAPYPPKVKLDAALLARWEEDVQSLVTDEKWNKEQVRCDEEWVRSKDWKAVEVEVYNDH